MTPGAEGKWHYSVVHNFDDSDGAVPAAAVIFDKQGNLYGTIFFFFFKVAAPTP